MTARILFHQIGRDRGRFTQVRTLSAVLGVRPFKRTATGTRKRLERIVESRTSYLSLSVPSVREGYPWLPGSQRQALRVHHKNAWAR